MRILATPFGAVALALGLFVTDAHQAVAQCCGNHSCRSGGVNITQAASIGAFLPTQMATAYPTPSPMLPYSSLMPRYYPMVPAYPSSGSQAPTSSSTSAPSSVKSPSGSVLPSPSGIAEKNDANPAPAEAPVRLRYWELSVSGLQGAADKERLTAALDTMKGSRGATVKGKPGDPATIKVWYSEKEPIEADAVMQAVTNLGFTGKVVGG